MIKIGFIGTGLIARAHALQLREVDDASIVSCFDIDSERSSAFAKDFGATPAIDAAQVIHQSDAVYVCTWTSEHPKLVSQVATAKKAIFCEKPLAKTLAQAQAMTDLVEAAGVTNQVGLVLRHSPAFRWLHAQAQNSRHGDPMSIVFRDDQYIPIQGLYGSTWRSDPKRAGAGTLIEHSVHDLDLITWMLGPIETVSCHTANHHQLVGIEDQATVTLKARNGAHAVLVSVWHDVLSRPSQRRVELFMMGGVFGLEGDWNGPVTAELASDSSIAQLSEQALKVAAEETDGLGFNPDADFISAIRDDTQAYPGFSLALEAHRIVDAAYRSAQDGGRPISLI